LRLFGVRRGYRLPNIGAVRADSRERVESVLEKVGILSRGIINGKSPKPKWSGLVVNI
jgi:hypothetical protein